eukprot:7008990-Prymnesium_polylepis.1
MGGKKAKRRASMAKDARAYQTWSTPRSSHESWDVEEIAEPAAAPVASRTSRAEEAAAAAAAVVVLGCAVEGGRVAVTLAARAAGEAIAQEQGTGPWRHDGEASSSGGAAAAPGDASAPEGAEVVGPPPADYPARPPATSPGAPAAARPLP